MRVLRVSRSGRSGQAVVEFALVLPIFMLLLLGAVEFGRAYLRLHILTNAAREGARAGSMPASTESDVEARVADFLEGTGTDPSTCTTLVTLTDGEGNEKPGGLADAEQGDRVAITVQHDFDILSGSIIPGFQGTITLSACCVFRHE